MGRPKRPAGPPRPKRTFTAEFKAEAVRLLEERQAAGETLAAIARGLDLNPDQLRAWERQRRGRTALRPSESEAEELRRLRRENEILRQERDFLKKATAFFAKESR